jgi:hypothetical protein
MGTQKEPWDKEWAADLATKALRYLAKNYPECAASEVLKEHEDAAYAAAMDGDREGYQEALRAYCRAGRDAAMKIRDQVVARVENT